MTNLKYTQNCPICGRQLRVKTCYIGMTLTCQHCHGNFIARDSKDTSRDPSWDTPVDHVFNRLQSDLEKSGILEKSGVLVHSAEAR